MGPYRNLTVDFRAGDLFKNRRPLVGTGLQEGREAPLSQQHRTGKTVKIHTGQAFNAVTRRAQAGFQDFSGIGPGNFMFRCLQRGTRLLAGTVLAPVTAIAPRPRLEHHLGKALATLTRHNVVGTLGQPAQARRSPVQRQANGIQQRCLARTGRPGNRKNAISDIRRVSQVNLPFAHQRIEVGKTDLQNSHDCALAGLPSVGLGIVFMQ